MRNFTVGSGGFPPKKKRWFVFCNWTTEQQTLDEHEHGKGAHPTIIHSLRQLSRPCDLHVGYTHALTTKATAIVTSYTSFFGTRSSLVTVLAHANRDMAAALRLAMRTLAAPEAARMAADLARPPRHRSRLLPAATRHACSQQPCMHMNFIHSAQASLPPAGR